MLIILSCYSWKHGLMLKTLIAKYGEVKRLFGVILGWQFVSLVMVALAVILAIFMNYGSAVTLVSLLPGIILSLITLELAFLGAIIDVDVYDTFDYVGKDLCNQRNQSIKL